MAEGWDVGKLHASIQGKMKIEEELKKIADFDKYLLTAFDQKEIQEDRDLRKFCDNLFKYLLPRRLNSEMKRTLNDQIPKLLTHIGMSILCCSYDIQQGIFLEILENKVEIQNSGSLAQYFNNKAFSLHSKAEYSVFQKLQILASITLELSVFCYLKGNKNVKDHCAELYSSAFRYIFKKDFYGNGGWIAWEDFVSDDVKFYEKNRCEVQTLDSQTITVSGWLKRFDRWIARLPLKTSCNQTESASANNESGNQSNNVKNFHDSTGFTTHDSEKIPERTCGTLEGTFECLYSKDCPIAKKFQNKSNCLILNLLAIIFYEKDSYENLLQIIENDTNVKKLMEYCLLARLIVAIKECKLKLRNADILQCMELILRDNARMAAYCFIISLRINDEVDKAKSFKKKDSVGNISDLTAENLNRQKSLSTRESVERSSPIKETTSSVYQEQEKLLDSFLQNIKANDTSSASEICKIISNKATAEILLTSVGFGFLMKETVKWPENRWEDEWILSVMTLLLNNLQTNIFMHQPTVDGAQETESLAKEDSVVDTNPQLIKTFQCSGTKRVQSSVPSVSDREDIEIETVCDDAIAEQVGNLHQNTLSFSMCKECFNHNKEKFVEYYLTTAKNSIPENETSVEKRTLKKQKSSIIRITDETSVHKETSSTRKASDTAVVDLPGDNVYSEVTSKDVEQTHECETNNSP